MSGNCFSRFEKKYLLTRDQYDGLREALDSCMREDIYGRYTTCNIYYDTEDDLLIRRSMQKPSYKEKLRLRSYGTPEIDTIVYLEIKKKCQGIVSKRRIPLQLREAYDFTDRGIVPGHLKSRVEEQICEEIRFFLEKYPLQRKLYLAYDRLALSGVEDPEFRVTFDTAIRSRIALPGHICHHDCERKSGHFCRGAGGVWPDSLSQRARNGQRDPLSFLGYGGRACDRNGFSLTGGYDYRDRRSVDPPS